MRIAAQRQSTDIGTATSSTLSKKIGSEELPMTTAKLKSVGQSRELPTAEDQEISKEKLQNVVDTVNGFLQINQYASKFVFHEGLDRYFVQLVDTQTEEVVKEIPPKKLLDAFYEMEKLLGMIVDEKI